MREGGREAGGGSVGEGSEERMNIERKEGTMEGREGGMHVTVSAVNAFDAWSSWLSFTPTR